MLNISLARCFVNGDTNKRSRNDKNLSKTNPQHQRETFLSFLLNTESKKYVFSSFSVLVAAAVASATVVAAFWHFLKPFKLTFMALFWTLYL